jgi:hypothetical protein
VWGPLITLSKYIHVRSSFEEFIETNLMVQSEFNLVFWFVSYNIFSSLNKWGLRCMWCMLLRLVCRPACSPCCSCVWCGGSITLLAHDRQIARYSERCARPLVYRRRYRTRCALVLSFTGGDTVPGAGGFFGIWLMWSGGEA